MGQAFVLLLSEGQAKCVAFLLGNCERINTKAATKAASVSFPRRHLVRQESYKATYIEVLRFKL